MFASMPIKTVHESLDQFGEAPQPGGGQALPQGTQPEQEMPDINISFKRDVPKVGRNDDCPCGSGKKYKKCCGK